MRRGGRRECFPIPADAFLPCPSGENVLVQPEMDFVRICQAGVRDLSRGFNHWVLKAVG